MNERLFRLAQHASWWRHAWPYRWAHKPLCERFERDVVRIGRLNLCRGCLSLWTGVLGIGAWALSGNLPVATAARALTIILPTVALLSHPSLHARWPRPLRDLLRAAAGATIPLALHTMVGGRPIEGLLALAALASISALHKLRRAPQRAAQCDGCPELERPGICSGYRLQTQATLHHELQMEQDLLRRGFVPQLKVEQTR